VKKIEKNEMGGACSVYGVGKRRVQGFGGETGGKELGDPGVDGKIILRWIFRKWDVWIDLTQSRGRWRALVNVVMNFRVRYNAGNFLTSGKPVSYSGRTALHGVSQ